MGKKYYLSIALVVTFMLTLVSFVYEQSYDQMIVGNINNDSVLESPWGMNAHLTFPKSKDHVDELCRFLQKAHVQMVRLDVYWWYDNMFMQQDLCDRAVYYADKYNLEILLNFPQVPNRTDSAFVKEWLDMILSYANRYDGKHALQIEGEKEARYPKVRYFEVLNEVELNYKKQNLTVKDVYLLIKKSSEALHNMSLINKPLVLNPGIGIFNEFAKKLLLYQENGKTFLDYVDILNIHLYPQKTEDFTYIMKRWKERKTQYNCETKKLWITEIGNTQWEVSEETQVNNLVKQNILSVICGVEKVFYYQFHSFGGNYFKEHNQREEYFGIVEDETTMPYVSFWVNDGVFKTPLSEGDGLKKVYVNPQNKGCVSVYSITDNMCLKIRNNGVAIGGDGLTLVKAVIKKDSGNECTVWTGKQRFSNNRRRIIRIPSQMFRDLTSNDRIVVYYDDKNVNGSWEGIRPMRAYRAYKTIAEILTQGSTRPVFQTLFNGTVIVKWKNQKNNYCVLWNDKKDLPVKISFKKVPIYSLSINGDKKRLTKRHVLVGRSPVILKSLEDIGVLTN